MARHTDPSDNYAKVMEEKRVAILSHLLGVCEFPQNLFYKKCQHEGLTRSVRMDASK